MTQPSDAASSEIAAMQAYYDRRADWYDASMGYDDPKVVQSLEPVIEAVREPMRDRSVLEIACGPGFWTERVAPIARSILATDYNESTLAMARRKPIDSARVTFARADAYDLSSLPATFTGAFAVDWLAHVPKSRMPHFLAGLHARLTPGSSVVLCDQTPGPTSITDLSDAEGNHVQERELRNGARYRVIKHFFSDAEFAAFFDGTAQLIIKRFAEQRRVVVSYIVDPGPCEPRPPIRALRSTP